VWIRAGHALLHPAVNAKFGGTAPDRDSQIGKKTGAMQAKPDSRLGPVLSGAAKLGIIRLFTFRSIEAKMFRRAASCRK
jgi:hypothetical protein